MFTHQKAFIPKFVLRILLAATVIAPLAGCAQHGTEITFVFLTSSQEKAEQFWKGVISDFEAQNPDVKVDLQIYGWGEGKERIQELVDQGDPPELAKVATRWLPEFVFAGLAEPIDDYLTDALREEFYTGLIEEGAQYQGRTFGLPIAFTTRALYYNEDIFRQAGIEKPPETWEELFDASVEIGQLPGDVYGFGLQGSTAHIETSTYFYYFLWGNGGEVLTPDGVRAAFNSPEGVGALTFLQELIDAGGTQPDPTQDTRADLEQAFLEGRYAMVITFNGLASRLDNEAPDIDYGLAPIPYNTTNVSLGVTDSLILFSQAEHKEEAWRFVEFLYQDQYRLENFQWEGVLPEKQTLAAYPEVTDNATIDFFLELAPVARYEPLNVKSGDIASIVAEELEATYQGRKDPQTALDDAAARVNELLSYSATSW